ncbi:hypothetical protein ACRALDRAFT_1062365 [Sodiomyces alcalophilus JCM 7366]|uniref:uncharacterized protein n=1 Tax=Sodiomyces alcalophilus JCM 7366 TaxID=591952 RepID=UPI0039B4E7F6
MPLSTWTPASYFVCFPIFVFLFNPILHHRLVPESAQLIRGKQSHWTGAESPHRSPTHPLRSLFRVHFFAGVQ